MFKTYHSSVKCDMSKYPNAPSPSLVPMSSARSSEQQVKLSSICRLRDYDTGDGNGNSPVGRL